MFVYDFIEKVGRIDVKRVRMYGKKYIASNEEFSSEQDCNEQLDKYLHEFKKEIQRLPFLLNTKQSRKLFLHNLYDEFIHTEEQLTNQFQMLIRQSHDCIEGQKLKFRYCFHEYRQKAYLQKARKEYQNLFIAFKIRIEKIESAVDLLKLIALNDGIEIKSSEAENQERFKVKLSSSELSYLIYRLMQKVADNPDFNRSQLSRVLADNFSTKRTAAPQANQIRKHFTDVSDSVKERVESLFGELSATGNS